MDIIKHQELLNAAIAVMEEARQRLINEGLSPKGAEDKVEANFQRVNNDSRLFATVEELCK